MTSKTRPATRQTICVGVALIVTFIGEMGFRCGFVFDRNEFSSRSS